MIDLRGDFTPDRTPDSEVVPVLQEELQIAYLQLFVVSTLSPDRPQLPAWYIEREKVAKLRKDKSVQPEPLSPEQAAELAAHEAGLSRHAKAVQLAGASVALYANGLLQAENTDATQKDYDPSWATKYMIPAIASLAMQGGKSRAAKQQRGMLRAHEISYRLLDQPAGVALRPWLEEAMFLQRHVKYGRWVLDKDSGRGVVRNEVYGEPVARDETHGPEYAQRLASRETAILRQNPYLTPEAVRRLVDTPLRRQLLTLARLSVAAYQPESLAA